MFSRIPRIGTPTCLNIAIPLRASMSATSCGVVTTTAPERAIRCVRVSWTSPVPGGKEVGQVAAALNHASSALDARARRRIIAKEATVSDRPDSKSEARVWVVEPGQFRVRTDQLATEEPLEIRLRAAGIAEGAGPL